MDDTIATLHQLTASEFERVVAAILWAQGYAEVQVVGGANDRGVDITCRDSDNSLIAVQCKRYDPDRKVGALAIQHLSAMAFQRRAHRGIFVTTATFTASAREQANEFDIELVDGSNLARLANEHKNAIAVLLPSSRSSLERLVIDKAEPIRMVHIPYDEVYRFQNDLKEFLLPFPPDLPATLRGDWPQPTGDERQKVDNALSGFRETSPEGFRQAVALIDGQISSRHAGYLVTRWDKVRVSLLDSPFGIAKDYVLDVSRSGDGKNLRKVVRCHRLNSDEIVGPHDIYSFMQLVDRFSVNWDREYVTNGYFSCGAYSYIASLSPEIFNQMNYALVDGANLARGYFAGSSATFHDLATRQELPKSFVKRRQNEPLPPPKPQIWRRLINR